MLSRMVCRLLFLSTPSARRATPTVFPPRSILRYFYPRPPRGGRRRGNAGCGLGFVISIHALREEGDIAIKRAAGSGFAAFLSTPSARRATIRIRRRTSMIADFYPRPPRGGRRTTPETLSIRSRFLSTPSARRATNNQKKAEERYLDFYPRPPRGGRLPSMGRVIR